MEQAGRIPRAMVLDHPVRWAIVQELATGPRRAVDLSIETGLRPRLLAQHLVTLRDAGVVVAHHRADGTDYALDEGLARPMARMVAPPPVH